MAAAESTVRIHNATRDKLRELATAEGRTIPDVLGEILVDGRELAELMLDHDVGVSSSTRYEIKRIDEDYFVEDADGSAPSTAEGPGEAAEAEASGP